MFETLPPEVLEKIFRNSTTKEVKNVACCSRSCHHALRHLLWKYVVIPYPNSDLTQNSYAKLLDNLQYTQKLRLGQIRGLDESDGQEMLTKGFSYGFHYAKILGHCNPAKVKGIVFANMAPEAIHYAGSLFKNVKTVAFGKCNLNDAAVKEILSVESLRTLGVVSCSNVTDITIERLGEATHLTDLTFHENVGVPNVYNFVPFSTLTKLRSLTITSCCISDADLILLCQSLTKLDTLDLEESTFTDKGLSQIHVLTALKELNLERCPGVTGNSMLFISTLVALRKLKFSADMFINEVEYSPLDTDDVKDKLCGLMTVPTLCELGIVGEHDHHGKYVDSVMRQLCREDKWRVRVTQNGDFDRYILTCR